MGLPSWLPSWLRGAVELLSWLRGALGLPMGLPSWPRGAMGLPRGAAEARLSCKADLQSRLPQQSECLAPALARGHVATLMSFIVRASRLRVVTLR